MVYRFYTKVCHSNRMILWDVISPRILIRSFWNLEHLLNMGIRPCVAKIRIFQTVIFVFDKNSTFYPNIAAAFQGMHVSPANHSDTAWIIILVWSHQVCLQERETDRKTGRCRAVHDFQAYFHICPLWPWPLTFKINRVHPLTIVNMFAKSDKEIHNGEVSIVFTSLFP